MDKTDVHAITADTCCVVGWVPKEFSSSRSQRFDAGMQQKPEDFMDEEVDVVIEM